MMIIKPWLAATFLGFAAVMVLAAMLVDSVTRQATAGGISEVRFERDGCLGRCPAYTVVFREGGCALLDGRANLPKIGRYVGRVDFYRLARLVDEHDFKSLDSRYDMGVEDAPGFSLTVVRDGNSKTVTTRNAGAVPDNLFALSAVIDSLVYTNLWWSLKDTSIQPPQHHIVTDEIRRCARELQASDRAHSS